MRKVWHKTGWVPEYTVAEPLDVLSPVDLVNRYLIDAWGGVHLMCRLEAPTTDVFSPSRLNDLQDLLVGLITRLPESVPEIEVTWTANGDLRGLIEEHQRMDQEGILGKMRQARAEKLLAQVERGALVGCETHITFGTMWLGRNPTRKQVLRSPIGQREFEQAIIHLDAALETSKDIARRMGANLLPLEGREVADYFYRLLNPIEAIERGEPLRFDPDRTPFADAWLLSEIDTEPEGWEGKGLIRWGDMYHTVVTLVGKPLQSTPRIMDAATAQLPHRQLRYTFRVRMLDQISERDRLKHLRDKADQELQRPVNLFDQLMNPYQKSREAGQANIEAQEQLDEANSLLAEMRTGAETIVEAQGMWHLWHRRPEELLYRRDNLLTRLADVGGSRGYAERHGVMVAFGNSLPGSGGLMLDGKRYRARMAADLIPLNRGFTTGDRPVSLFRNASGGLISVDLWDMRHTTAPMVFISGKTGSGKSVLANHFIGTHALRGIPVMVLDFGGSYRTLAELLKVPVYEMEPTRPRVLNPFQLYGVTVGDDGVVQVPSAEVRSRIKASIQPLFVRETDPGGRLPDELNVLLGMALEQMFHMAHQARKPLCTLSDLAKRLEQLPDTRPLQVRLKQFLRGEEFGAWLDGPSEWSCDSTFFILDLRGIKKMSELARALLPLAMGVIYDTATRNRGQPKLLVFEELWQQLDTPEVLNMTIESFKTLRKEGAAVLGVSQSLADMASNKRASLAITQSVQTWFLFQQGDEDNRAIASETLKLTAGEATILRELGGALKMGQDGQPEIYRECLMVRGEGDHRQAGRVRVQLTPEEYWLYTSDPRDNQVRQQAIEACGDVWLALQMLAGQYPCGATTTGTG